jgi:DNA-binding transcriptional LysR family regulator
MDKDPYEVLDLKALRCFFAVAKHGSLAKAGIELGVSEAAVSQRVKALEGDLGVKLYDARGGRVRLTPQGDQTRSFAVSLFDEIKGFGHDLTPAPRPARSCFRRTTKCSATCFLVAWSNSPVRIPSRDCGCWPGGSRKPCV